MKTKKIESAPARISKVTGLPVDRKRSLAAKRAAATRKANALVAEEKRELRLHHKILFTGGIVAAVLFAILGIHNELQTYAASTANGTFTGLSGKCLDNDHSIAESKNPVQLWRCNGTNAQRWSLESDGSVKSANGGGKFCLDVPLNSANEFAYLRIYTCNGSAAQKFSVKDGALIHNTTGFCASVRYSSSDNGTRVWMIKCSKPLGKAQKWVYAADAATDTGNTGGGTTTPTPTPTPTPIPEPTPAPQPTPTPTPTPAPSNNYDLSDVVKKAASGKSLALNAGTYNFRNFNTTVGVDMTKLSGLQGQGSGKTVLQMVAKSSTRKGMVPTLDGKYNKDAAKTNPLYLIKFDGSPVLSGFTLQGTNQGHLYNGIRMERTSNARVSDIKIAAVPGDSDVPPGETFGLNDYGSNGSVYRNIEIDGSTVGSSLFATNSTSNVTVTDSNFYNSKHGNGAAFWKTSGTTTITNVKATGNKDFAFNFERVSGTVIAKNTYSCNNKWGDFRMSNDKTSAVYKIIDPKFCGSKLKIRCIATYDGDANKQKKSDIHVIINGVDKTSSVVEWIR